MHKILNTITRKLFNKVLVLCIDCKTNKVVNWWWEKASEYPKFGVIV